MIEIKPSHIVIKNYTKNYKLEKSLSVWNKAYHIVDWSAMYMNEDGDLVIPKGYNPIELQKLFPNKKIEISTAKCSRFLKVNFNINTRPRDHRQENAIHFLLGDTPYFSYTNYQTQKMLCLKTGKGKTYCSIAYNSELGKLAMIITDMDSSIKQWKNEYLKFTDIKEDEIYIISGINSINKLFKKKPLLHGYKVFLASHRTLSSFMKEDSTLVDKLFKHLGIGLKIYDEAHVEWRNIFLIDATTNIYETLYLTATPSRSNELENVVYQNMFENIIQYGLEHKYKEKYQTVVYVNYNTQPELIDETSMKTTNYGFNVNEYSEYLITKRYEIFFSMIEELLKIIFKSGNPKIAIVVHKNDMVQKLHDDLKEIYPSKTFGRFCGLVHKNKKMKELESNIIITTDKSFNKAVDVKGLEAIINTVPLSSNTLIEQIIGRLRYIEGKKVVYFDITDIGFKSCCSQRTIRKKLLNVIAKEALSINI